MFMKIIHRFNPGSQRSHAFGMDGLFGGAFGLAGTLATNAVNADIAESQIDAQREENQKNRDYNTVEAEKARQFSRDMLFSQQSYATQQWENQQRNALGLQLQGARENGVNPNVLLSGGSASASGGSVASPSAPSGAQASFSSGLSPVPYQALNPAGAFAQVAQGLQSLATAKEKGVNVGLIENQIENMSVDTQYKEVLLEGVQLANKLTKLDLKYRDKKLCQDIEEQVVRIGSLKSTIELQRATTKIQDSIRKLNESLSNKHDQESELVKLDIANYDKKLNSYLKLQVAQIKESNAKAFEASQAGNLNKFNAQIAEVESKIKNDPDVAASRLEASLEEYAAKYAKSKEDSEAARLAASRLRSINFERDKSDGFRMLDDTFEWIKKKMSIFGNLEK